MTEGPPLLLLHHAGGSSRRWRRVLPALSRRYAVRAPDLPGHGASPVPEGSSWAAWTGFLPSSLRETPSTEGAAVVAHSLAGLAAVTSLLEKPLPLAGLVLVAPPTGRGDLPSPIRISRPGAAERAVTWRRYREAVRGRLAGDPSRIPEQDWKAVHDDFILPSVQETLRTLLTDYPRLDALPLPAPGLPPTLILWGERDRIVPVESLHRWRAALPEASHEVLPDVGHLPMLEDPDAFVRAVERFLG